MNAFCLKQISCVLSAAALIGFFSHQAAAETVPSTTIQLTDQSTELNISASNAGLNEVLHSANTQATQSQTSQQYFQDSLNYSSENSQPRVAVTLRETAQSFDQNNDAAIAPPPGIFSTQAAALQQEPPAFVAQPNDSLLSQSDSAAPSAQSTPAQTTPDTTAPPPSAPAENKVTPGRATRSGSSYFGVGGNFGVGDGDTAVGRTSFALYSKIGLLRYLSVRPALLIRSDVTLLIPVTYDFSFGEGPTENLGFRAAPFVGAGPAITTGGGGNVDLLLTGGIDIPLSSRFTATAAVNATVTGNPAVGIFIGVGYNFSGF